MKGLPGAIDVEKFAESRAFEINAMHEAMHNARSNSTARAWQQLPRHLRRRAASHDVRRVPLRLRDKARAEMDPARRKALGRNNPKQGKLKKVRRTVALLRRQKDKTWLETHIWHAKRMHMDNMWGYRLAITPTEKSFRPSHRASVHGSILHDASYFATIELKGPEDIIREALANCCDCQGPGAGAKRFLTGARATETYIYEFNKYPYGLIGPATIMWHADAPGPNGPQAPAIIRGTNAKGKGDGKEKEVPWVDPERRIRIVWIRVHPSITEEVHEALRVSTAFALDAAKQTGRTAEVEIADLREHFNVFEIMGPKASQVIKGALKPVDDKRDEFKRFWTSLNRIQSAGAVPRGMVIGFTVHDPRLSFPPKNVQLNIESGPSLSPASTVFPSACLAQSQIWDEDVRMVLRKPRYKKKDLDQRRSNNLVPGTPLKSERNDDRVPVLLIQRSVENAALSQIQNFPRLSSTTSLHGWTLIVPQGWGMPFLSSLIYTGTRVGGQRERQTQAFEAGCTYFPRDFPTTEAYDVYAEDKEDEEREAWERKPPAKRPNYEKLGTRSPWRPDWGVVLGIEEPAKSHPEAEELLDTQRDPMVADEAAATEGNRKVDIWLLRGPDIPQLVAEVSSMLNPAAGLLSQVNQARAKRKLDPLPVNLHADDLIKGALVQVSITLCGRGFPDDLAIIYRVGDDEAKEWMRAEVNKKNGLSLLQDGPDETELSQVPPPSEGIIGYVTTGNFSLSLGEGHAVGAIPLSQYLDLRKQAQRLRNDTKLLVKLRNRHETRCRAALVELLH
ncbi:POP1-domain-containing protein [Dichomitus squalens]|nr:POP1-domain-containing protein [Dichomitus squalens]